jgi:hypothetical protein
VIINEKEMTSSSLGHVSDTMNIDEIGRNTSTGIWKGRESLV